MAKTKKKKKHSWDGILSVGLFFDKTDPQDSPFGLTADQRRLGSIQNNAGWFNIRGEKVGTGDLSMADLERISLEILGGEFFVVLSEFDAFWGMPPGMSTSMPGLDYVLTNCSWIAISGFIFRARNSVSSVAGQSKDGVAYIELPRKEFFAKVGYDPKAKAFIKQKPKAEETPKERADDDIFNALFTKFASQPTHATPPAQVGQAAGTTGNQTLPGFPAPAAPNPSNIVIKPKKKIKRSVP